MLEQICHLPPHMLHLQGRREENHLYRRDDQPLQEDQQHFKGFENQARKSVLFQHMDERHPHTKLDKFNFKLEVTGYQRTALGCQAEEGVLIMQELKDLDKHNTAPAQGGGRGGGGSCILILEGNSTSLSDGLLRCLPSFEVRDDTRLYINACMIKFIYNCP